MSDTNTSETKTKRAFDFARDTLWKCDPTDDLCIIGGAAVLPDEQLGELDTEDGADHPLYDERLASITLAEDFVRNIDAYGVIEPVVIAKVDTLAVVIDGRQRVRAARVVNQRRRDRGEPLITVPCVVQRRTENQLALTMVLLNEQRHDDDISTKIEKLKRVMGRGVSIEDAALAFKVPVTVCEAWLAFDDTAIQRIKDAVAAGRLALTAGIEIAAAGDANAQSNALDEVEREHASSGGKGKITVRKARAAAKKIKKGVVDGERLDTRSAKRLLKFVRDKSHPSHTSEKTRGWWEGVEAALKIVLGDTEDGPHDDRILKALTEARAETGK